MCDILNIIIYDNFKHDSLSHILIFIKVYMLSFVISKRNNICVVQEPQKKYNVVVNIVKN